MDNKTASVHLLLSKEKEYVSVFDLIFSVQLNFDRMLNKNSVTHDATRVG